MNFDGVVGQEEIIRSLQNAVMNNKVGHACIFSGPKGVGKRMIAEAYAGILLCARGEEGKACGVCPSCQMVENGSNPDFHIIEAEGNSIGIEEIRKIQGEIMVKPLYSSRKVYLIIDADKMTVQAQNCLLKTLEEPPPYAVLILTTSNYKAILETIRSRVAKYNFQKNTYEEIIQILTNKLGGTVHNTDFITAYSDGIPGVAIELASSEEFSGLRQKVVDMILRLGKSKLVEVFEIYDFFETNKNNVDRIFDIMTLIYRDLLIVKKSQIGNVLINSDKKDIIESNASRFSSDKLISNIEEIEKTRRNIKQNANYQLSIEVMLMKLQEE